MKNLVILSLSFFLTSCFIANGELVKPTKEMSVIEFTNALRDDTSTGLDVAMVKLNGFPSKYSDYIEYKTWWCPRHEQVNSTAAVVERYKNLCKAKGGFYKNSFCYDYYNNVIFYAQVANSGKCSGGYQTSEVDVIEPTGSKKSSNYITALKSKGYRTDSEISNDYLKEIQQKKAYKEKERQKLKKYSVPINTIGIKICKIKNGITYLGYVERIEKKKIQIRVSKAFYSSNNSYSPGNFKSSIIWDYPKNWYICE